MRQRLRVRKRRAGRQGCARHCDAGAKLGQKRSTVFSLATSRQHGITHVKLRVDIRDAPG